LKLVPNDRKKVELLISNTTSLSQKTNYRHILWFFDKFRVKERRLIWLFRGF